MAPTYKFALVQFFPKDASPENNFAKAESYIRRAASQGAHLAVLPEYHLTSWCPSHPEFISSCASSATYLSRYRALARELNISICPGTICEVHDVVTVIDDDEDTKKIEIRNMAYWIAPDGSLSGTYQKKNLWHPERPHLTAGTSAPHRAFDTPLTWDGGKPIRAGMLVCWDTIFPEGFRALIADGADLVVIPSFWLVRGEQEFRTREEEEGEQKFLRSVITTRAFENTCVVVFVNAGGLSQVAVPVLGTGAGEEGIMGVETEEMKVVEVDFAKNKELEGRYKIRDYVLSDTE